MNVLKYLNSKDARAHLESLCYEFSPLDSAKIIEACDRIDVKEKHRAFLELIEETADEVVVICGDYICEEEKTTLHTLLRSYMDAENEAIRSFYRDDPDSVYVINTEDSFSSILCRDYREELSSFMNSGPEDRIVITKRSLSTGAETDVCFDKSRRIMWVHDMDRFILPYTALRLNYRFTRMPPTPFEIGDVVLPTGKYKTQPLVITDFDEETVSGYIFTKGQLTETTMYRTVAELEYYPVDEVPVLKAVSDYIKGKTKLYSFINTYHRAAFAEYIAQDNDREGL